MKTTCVVLGLILLLYHNGFAQPEGYRKTARGLLYKIVTDAGQPKAQMGDIIKMNAIYATTRDSILFSTFEEGMGPIQMTIGPPTFNGDPMEGFSMLGEGDSAIFLMPADSAFKTQEYPSFAKRGDYIRISVSVLSRMSKSEFERKKAEDAIKQTEMEIKTIEEYLLKNNMTAQKTSSGLYYVITEQGAGLKAEPGKKVTLNYTGKLLDGHVFDSSLNPGRSPFSFQLGGGRVIKGWEEGIALFHAGGKGTLIIPSPLAYGSRGAGTIPPNSILIFDVEILKVE